MLRVGVAGAGLAGSIAGFTLKRLGFKPQLWEAAHSTKLNRPLLLGPSAMAVFRRLGLKDQLVHAGQRIPLYQQVNNRGQVMLGFDSRSLFSKISSFHKEETFLSIMSSDLLRILQTDVSVSTSTSLQDINFIPATEHEPEHMKVKLKSSQGESVQDLDFLIAADGHSSPTRRMLGLHSTSSYQSLNQVLITGYSSAPAIAPFLNEAVTEIIGNGSRFGGFQLAARGSFCWYAFISGEVVKPTLDPSITSTLLEIFKEYPESVRALIKSTSFDALSAEAIVSGIQFPPTTLGTTPTQGPVRVAFVGSATQLFAPEFATSLNPTFTVESAAILGHCLRDAVKATQKKSDKSRIQIPRPIISQQLGRYADLTQPRANSLLAISTSEAHQTEKSSGFMASLRVFATGMLPDDVKLKPFEKFVAYDPLDPFYPSDTL